MFEMVKSLIRPAKVSLSSAIQIGYEEANDGLKNVSFYCGDALNRNGTPWYITRHVLTKTRETGQIPYVHGRFHDPRPNIVSFCLPSRKISLRQD